MGTGAVPLLRPLTVDLGGSDEGDEDEDDRSGTHPGMKVPCQLCGTRKVAEMTCPNPACPSHRQRRRPSVGRRRFGA